MSYINEGATSAFSTVVKFIDNFIDNRNAAKVKRNFNSKKDAPRGLRRSSIMSATKDLVMSFPILCSDSIQPNVAGMISKAIERNCVTQLQLLFSATYLAGNNGQEVLKQWHNNLETNRDSMDDYLDILDAMEVQFAAKESKTVDFVSNKYPNLAVDMINEVKINNNKFYPITSFSEASINCYEITESYNGIDVRRNVLKEADEYIINPFDGLNGNMSKAQFDANMSKTRYDQEAQKNANANTTSRGKNRTDNNRFEYEKKRDKRNDRYQSYRDFKNDENMEFRNGIEFGKFAQSQVQDKENYFKRQLLDNDVKKFNELVPSMIIVRYNVADASNSYGNAIESEFVAGVKTRLIPVSSEEIIDRVNVVFKNRPSKLNWVRATTGEINFMKDFVMGIEQAKIDAKRDSKLSKTSPIWRSLQYRANKSNINRLRKNRANDAGAITTLVITQDEVDYIKQNFGVDLSIPAKANYLMTQYNFMGIVIVDETFEVARFLFDGGNQYDDLSFSNLERETGDTSYKKVVNLISKINRG